MKIESEQNPSGSFGKTPDSDPKKSSNSIPANTGSSGVTPAHIFRNQKGMIKEMLDSYLKNLYRNSDQAK